ncbi:hypothetical protein RF007C_02875 [Ruminococcus flavefaciens 007c]|uniref:Uncharacterized protein n=1 Tax=Ruminococcus flavefaciens 007c TaxID=1341157 RepID=W7V2B2_RUMFL|nr:hypothetical protein RF007C_02875 [Ruminococcus flavefaciens 007c]
MVAATVTLVIVILSADITAASSHAGNSKKEAPPVGGIFIITYQKVYLLHQGQEDNTFCLFDGFQ